MTDQAFKTMDRINKLRNTSFLQGAYKFRWVIVAMFFMSPFISLVLALLNLDILTSKFDDFLDIKEKDLAIREKELVSVDYDQLIYNLPLDSIVEINITCSDPYRLPGNFTFKVLITNHVRHEVVLDVSVFSFGEDGNRTLKFSRSVQKSVLPAGQSMRVMTFRLEDTIEESKTYQVVIVAEHVFRQTQKRNIYESDLCLRKA